MMAQTLWSKITRGDKSDPGQFVEVDPDQRLLFIEQFRKLAYKYLRDEQRQAWEAEFMSGGVTDQQMSIDEVAQAAKPDAPQAKASIPKCGKQRAAKKSQAAKSDAPQAEPKAEASPTNPPETAMPKTDTHPPVNTNERTDAIVAAASAVMSCLVEKVPGLNATQYSEILRVAITPGFRDKLKSLWNLTSNEAPEYTSAQAFERAKGDKQLRRVR